jgi:hypothetical protein
MRASRTVLIPVLGALFLLAAPAQAQPGVSFFGTATPGCAGTGSIGVNSAPRLGNAGFAITCAGAYPGATGALLMSAGRLVSPVFIGAAAIWADPARGFFIPVGWTPGGTAAVPLAIPSNGSLIGYTVYCQFGWLDPGPPCVGLATAATLAMQLVLQCPAPAGPTTITSGPRTIQAGTTWHPVLQTTTFTVSGPCAETVTVNAQGSFTTNCQGESHSIDVDRSVPNFPESIAAGGGSPFNLTGSFRAVPGRTYMIGLVVSLIGAPNCTATLPPNGGTATLTFTRSP